MRTQFCIYGEPRGKERPKFSTVCGHVTARTPENTVLYENLVKTEYRIQSGVRFADDAMLSVRIFAFLSVPRSASQKKHLAMIDRLIRPTRKPDFDNIGKIICDALNGIAYLAEDPRHVDDSILEPHLAEEIACNGFGTVQVGDHEEPEKIVVECLECGGILLEVENPNARKGDAE
jgi:Holliday junction resolvase RusA-like endonuclease